MEIYLSLLVAILGGFVHLTASNGRVSELGRIAFAIGLLAFLFGPAPAQFLRVISR